MNSPVTVTFVPEQVITRFPPGCDTIVPEFVQLAFGQRCNSEFMPLMSELEFCSVKEPSPIIPTGDEASPLP